MNRRRMLLVMRIAFSVVCGIAAVLLVVLWVRSYQTLDNMSGQLPGSPAVSCTSAYGRMVVGTQNVLLPWKWDFQSTVLDGKSFGGRPKEPRNWFIFNRTAAFSALQAPHGFLVLVAAAVSILPWLPWRRWRFSVRTLLIGMTLVAVLLGIAMWAAH